MPPSLFLPSSPSPTFPFSVSFLRIFVPCSVLFILSNSPTLSSQSFLSEFSHFQSFQFLSCSLIPYFGIPRSIERNTRLSTVLALVRKEYNGKGQKEKADRRRRNVAQSGRCCQLHASMLAPDCLPEEPCVHVGSEVVCVCVLWKKRR